jgi:hypothetical protein
MRATVYGTCCIHFRLLPAQHHLCPLDERLQALVVRSQSPGFAQRGERCSRLARLQRGDALAAVFGCEHALAHQLFRPELWRLHLLLLCLQ